MALAHSTSTSTSSPVPRSVVGEPTTPSRRRRVDPAVAALLLIGALFGAVFAAVTPPFWGPDEPAHVARAWTLLDGVVAPHPIPDATGPNYGGDVPSSLSALMTFSAEQLARQPEAPAPRVTDAPTMDALASRSVDAPATTIAFPSSQTYSPVPYLPSMVGLAVARGLDTSVGTAVLLARLANLVFYLGLTAAALAVLRPYRLRWVVLVTALLPMSLFEGAMVSADGPTVALVLLFGAVFLRSVFLRDPLSTPHLVLLVLAALAIPLSKSAYAVFVPLLLVVAATIRGPRQRIVVHRLVLVIATVLSIAAGVVWNAIAAVTQQTGQRIFGSAGPDRVDAGGQIAFALSHPGELVEVLGRTFVFQENMYFSQFFGDLGWAFIPIPSAAWVAIGAAAVLAAGTSERLRAGPTVVISVGAVVLLGVALIFGALYAGFTPVGYYQVNGVQGRYFLPFALFVAAIVMRLVPLRLDTSVLRSSRSVPVSVVSLMALALALGAAKYSYVLWH